MAEWLVEEGIGEERAIRLDADGIAAARLLWPGALAAGTIDEAQVLRRIGAGSAALVRFAGGEEAIATRIPRALAEGSRIRCEVTRAALSERGRLKLAQARPTSRPPRPAPTLAEALSEEGEAVRIVPRFPPGCGWEELWADAWDGRVAFPGGALLLDCAAAMTLIDVDADYPQSVVHNAVPALARTLARFDIGGNIAIDFPTLADRGDRKVVDARLSEALAGWPHERTAMNGFGLVQLVARLVRPSLVQMLSRDRCGAAARMLLRRAEGLSGPGAIELAARPEVLAALRPAWRDELARRMGTAVILRPGPELALPGGHAQLVPR